MRSLKRRLISSNQVSEHGLTICSLITRLVALTEFFTKIYKLQYFPAIICGSFQGISEEVEREEFQVNTASLNVVLSSRSAVASKPISTGIQNILIAHRISPRSDWRLFNWT